MLMRLYFSFLFFCGIWGFSSNRKHLLATLLSLEFMVLVLFVVVYFYLCSFNYELYFVMFFLVFSVCEGSLGLSILVSMIRGFGNDYFQSYSVLQC
uniref:NADH-ubiquinone oxidoreductase chain 4L n=1 Tax=Procryptotermes speiseri TaxID=2942699 RepID=A0A8X8M3V3_9NEOP|nr:NADH dehydrogenase subunit 4L [Procryptotermes speiseri]